MRDKMPRMIKLDLHTHAVEALKKEFNIRGIRDINEQAAGAIVKAVKAAGLQGIAITERNNFNYGWVTGLQVLDFFKYENVVILPGVEVEYQGLTLLQLYIPDYYRRRIPFFKQQDWFVILAGPGFNSPLDISQLEGLQIDAVEASSLKGQFPAASEISRSLNIPLLDTSDADSLSDLGKAFIEVEFRG